MPPKRRGRGGHPTPSPGIGRGGRGQSSVTPTPPSSPSPAAPAPGPSGRQTRCGRISVLPPGLSQDFVLDIATHSEASSHLSDRSIGDLFVGGISPRVSPNQQRKRGRSSTPVPFHPSVQQGGNGDQLAAVSEQPAPADQLTGAVRHGLQQGRGDMSAQQAGRGQQESWQG